MRTVFEDTQERERRDEAKDSGGLLTAMLWVFALVFLAGSWATWHWAANRKPPEPPPPPVSLEDPKQVSDTLNKFNRFIQEDNWGEAEKMLSNEAVQRLATEKKTLRESVLAELKDQKVVQAAVTPSGSKTPTTVRQDCVFQFADGKYKIIPIVVVNDGGKLAINSW